MKKWEFSTNQLGGLYLTGVIAGVAGWHSYARVQDGGSEAGPLLIVVLMVTAAGMIVAMGRPVKKGKPKKR